ncbi:hypothetical protein N665_0108s0066 [Sinapis alba]|nr:hypothetical protein N665_0108s0066 [Sinapis alba]
MSMIRRLILGRRAFSTAVARRAEEVMSNPDCRATDVGLRVWYLIASVGDLDTAEKYARLAPFTRMEVEAEAEATEGTCETIIGSMFEAKRHKEAYDLYDFFFNKHKLKPTNRCCNLIIESRFQQGLVDEALDFHRSHPNDDDTLRVLTKGLVHSGRLDQAEALLKARKSCFYRPDHVAFNNLIRGFLDLGNLDKANLVLDEFKRVWSDSSALKPHDSLSLEYEQSVAFLMATFMEYWFKQGKEMEAMQCYEDCVVANKLPVCAETGNALLKILLKYGQKTHAWALYHDMFDQSQSGISSIRRLHSATVKIMVDECFDMGQCSQAIETYNKARAKNNFLADSYIITRCCENGMLSEAESLFADSHGLGFGVVDVAVFKTMIAAYLNAGRIDDALKTSNMLIDASLLEVSKLF